MPLRLPLGGISNSRCSLQRSMLFWCTVTLIRLECVLYFESLEVHLCIGSCWGCSGCCSCYSRTVGITAMLCIDWLQCWLQLLWCLAAVLTAVAAGRTAVWAAVAAVFGCMLTAVAAVFGCSVGCSRCSTAVARLRKLLRVA